MILHRVCQLISKYLSGVVFCKNTYDDFNKSQTDIISLIIIIAANTIDNIVKLEFHHPYTYWKHGEGINQVFLTVSYLCYSINQSNFACLV